MKTSVLWDVKKWILSYGAEAKVLEPEKLRKELAEEVAAMKNRYN